MVHSTTLQHLKPRAHSVGFQKRPCLCEGLTGLDVRRWLRKEQEGNSPGELQCWDWRNGLVLVQTSAHQILHIINNNNNHLSASPASDGKCIFPTEAVLNKGLPFPGSRRGGRWTFGLPSLSQRKVIKCIKYICFPFSSCWVSQPKSHNRTMRFGKSLPPTSAPPPQQQCCWISKMGLCSCASLGQCCWLSIGKKMASSHSALGWWLGGGWDWTFFWCCFKPPLVGLQVLQN